MALNKDTVVGMTQTTGSLCGPTITQAVTYISSLALFPSSECSRDQHFMSLSKSSAMLMTNSLHLLGEMWAVFPILFFLALAYPLLWFLSSFGKLLLINNSVLCILWTVMGIWACFLGSASPFLVAILFPSVGVYCYHQHWLWTITDKAHHIPSIFRGHK